MRVKDKKPSRVSKRLILINESKFRDLLRFQKVMQFYAFRIDLPEISEDELVGIEATIDDDVIKQRISRR